MKTYQLHMLGGFLVGCFIGLKVLPSLPPFKSAPENEPTAAELISARARLASQIETTLELAVDIAGASVHLSEGGASVTLKLAEDVITERLATVAAQVASAYGIDAGEVSVFNGDGEHLNLRALQEYQQKKWWTNVAINVAKVLGILAALITLKYIIQVVGKATGVGGDSAEAR